MCRIIRETWSMMRLYDTDKYDGCVVFVWFLVDVYWHRCQTTIWQYMATHGNWIEMCCLHLERAATHCRDLKPSCRVWDVMACSCTPFSSTRPQRIMLLLQQDAWVLLRRIHDIAQQDVCAYGIGFFERQIKHLNWRRIMRFPNPVPICHTLSPPCSYPLVDMWPWRRKVTSSPNSKWCKANCVQELYQAWSCVSVTDSPLDHKCPRLVSPGS